MQVSKAHLACRPDKGCNSWTQHNLPTSYAAEGMKATYCSQLGTNHCTRSVQDTTAHATRRSLYAVHYISSGKQCSMCEAQVYVACSGRGQHTATGVTPSLHATFRPPYMVQPLAAVAYKAAAVAGAGLRPAASPDSRWRFHTTDATPVGTGQQLPAAGQERMPTQRLPCVLAPA